MGIDRYANRPVAAQVLFELRRCQFCCLAGQGRKQEALQQSRTQLTPLAEGSAPRQAAVRAALLSLLPGKAAESCLAAAGAALQDALREALGFEVDKYSLQLQSTMYVSSLPSWHPVALGCRLADCFISPTSAGLLSVATSCACADRMSMCIPATMSSMRYTQEPRLVKLMTALLSAHGEWFRLQRCKDRFSGPLGVDALKEAEPESDAEGAVTVAPAPSSCKLLRVF